jgi:hypothetical protein
MTTAPNPQPPAPPAQDGQDLSLNSNSAGPMLNQEPGLSPEEQLARFEEDLKENDWGHQPC